MTRPCPPARYGSLREWLADLPKRQAARASDAAARQHRHLITRHVHPEWHGHCGDPLKRGWKPCGRPHWHFWWKHSHPTGNDGGSDG